MADAVTPPTLDGKVRVDKVTLPSIGNNVDATTVTPLKLTNSQPSPRKNAVDDLGWGDQNGVLHVGIPPATKKKDVSLERQSILDSAYGPDPDPNVGRFERKKPAAAPVDNRNKNGQVRDQFDQKNGYEFPNIAKGHGIVEHSAHPTPILPQLPPLLKPLMQPNHTAPQPVIEKVDVNVFMAELLGEYCANFLDNGTCGFSGACNMACSTRMDNINLDEVKNFLKAFNNDEIVYIFNQISLKYVLFNKLFPVLADVMGTRKMVQLLVDAIRVCERPQYLMERK